MGRIPWRRVKLPSTQETWVPSLGREDPLRRAWLSTPVFWPGESRGQRSLAGYSPWGHERVRHDLAAKQQQQPTVVITEDLHIYCSLCKSLHTVTFPSCGSFIPIEVLIMIVCNIMISEACVLLDVCWRNLSWFLKKIKVFYSK